RAARTATTTTTPTRSWASGSTSSATPRRGRRCFCSTTATAARRRSTPAGCATPCGRRPRNWTWSSRPPPEAPSSVRCLTDALAFAGRWSHFFQVLVDELDRHRPFADGRGDALDRPGAHVPCREHAGAAGLQQERLPPERPVGRPRHRCPRLYETLLVP